MTKDKRKQVLADHASPYSTNPTLIFGIDPGSHKCGWGLVSRQGLKVEHVCSDVIKIKGNVAARLSRVNNEIQRMIVKFNADVVAIEDVFVGQNQRTALAIGQARGAILAAVGSAEIVLGRSILIEDLPPAVTKKTLTGNGRASKLEVSRAVVMTLKLKSPPQEDEADALAAAITAARRWRAD